jgi:lysophospholipase L1-like esterase
MSARASLASAFKSRRVRFVCLASFAAALLAGILAYRRYWLRVPLGSGPAGPAVPREAFENAWTARKVLLLGLGDSITTGVCASAPRYSYFARLVSNPPDEFPGMSGICLSRVLPDLEVRNVSVPGTNSIQHLAMQIERLEVHDPEILGIVVMTTGVNDVFLRYGRVPPREGAMYGAGLDTAGPWIEAFGRRLGVMADRLEAAFPGGCHLFLANIYDPSGCIARPSLGRLPEWPDGAAVLHAMNEEIARLARDRRNVHLVNVFDEFLGHGLACGRPWSRHYRPDDPHYWFGCILEDPNDRGYDAMRRRFLAEMARVLR